MRSISLKRRGFGRLAAGLLALAVLATVPCFFSGTATADDGPVLKTPRPVSGAGSRADHGENRLERLPWNTHILRADLSRDRPVAVAGFYLMERHLIVVTQSGRVYCLDRFNLQPRWVQTLKAPLFRAPCESPTHFCFLCKDYQGAYWLHSISKSSGAEGIRFPRRIPFSASSGVAATGSMAFMGSLGSPRNNKTFESLNLITGRRGWGYRATGLIFGSPAVDPEGDAVVFATDDGIVTSLPAGVSPPSDKNWSFSAGSTVKGGPAVTPKHVVVANRDGMVYNLDMDTGRVNWLKTVKQAVNTPAWILGGWKTSERDSGIEGAAPIKVRDYVGHVFVRNLSGLHAMDLTSGDKQFTQADDGRPLTRQGKWIVTIDSGRKATLRDASDDYKVKATLDLSPFDLLPTNTRDGAIYACTSDGGIVAALPARR